MKTTSKRKNAIVLLAVMVMLIAALVTACGTKETIAEETQELSTDTAPETMQLDETQAQAPAEEFSFPDMGYDEWFTDDAGNKLWGYQTPLGFVKKEEYSGNRRAVYFRGGEQKYEGEFEVCCFEDKDGKWKKWYEDGEVNPDAYDAENTTIIENGTIITPYGTFKDYILDDNRETYQDSEIAFLYLPTGQYVEIRIGLSGWTYEGSMKHLLDILTGEKQEQIEISDVYENCLCAETGEKILGFHTPEGYKLGDNDTDNIIRLEGGIKSISIYEFNEVTKVYEDGDKEILMGYQSNDDPIYTHYDYKEEIDSAYGTIKFYETKTDSFDTAYEEAILRVNGRYILLSYSDFDSDAYSGKLKEIVETQLFE